MEAFQSTVVQIPMIILGSKIIQNFKCNISLGRLSNQQWSNIGCGTAKQQIKNSGHNTKFPSYTAEHKLREKQLGTCRFCFENPRIAKHLIISIGKKSYLAVPINASLTDGHCLIVPMNHVIGQTFFDEDVMEEVKVRFCLFRFLFFVFFRQEAYSEP